jgi:hypothetical protein
VKEMAVMAEVPVDEKIFTSELRRIDSDIANMKKSQEKFESRTEKAIGDLRVDMNRRFEKMDARFDKLDARFGKLENTVEARFEKLENTVEARFGKLESTVDARFEKLENSVDARFGKLENSVNTRFEKVDAHFDKVDTAIYDLRKEMHDRLWWVFGAIILSVLVPVILKYL